MSYTAAVLCAVFTVYGIIFGIARGICIRESSCDVRKLYNARMSELSEKAASEKSLMTNRPEELRLYTQAYDNLCQYKEKEAYSHYYDTYLFSYEQTVDGELLACYWFIGDRGMGGAKRMLQHVLADLLINAIVTAFMIVLLAKVYGVINSVIIGAVILVSFTLSEVIYVLIKERFGDPPLLHSKIRWGFDEFNRVSVLPPISAEPVPSESFYSDCTEQQREEFNKKIEAHRQYEQFFKSTVDSCVKTMTALSRDLVACTQYCRAMHRRAITVSTIYALSVPVLMFITCMIMILH